MPVIVWKEYIIILRNFYLNEADLKMMAVFFS